MTKTNAKKAAKVTETEKELQDAQTAGVKPPKATTTQEKDIALWRKLNIVAKDVEPKLKDVRDRLALSITALGVEVIDTKAGPLKLSTKPTTDWEGLARAHLSEDVINRVDWERFARGELGKGLVEQFALEKTETNVTWESLVRLSLPAEAVAEKQVKYTELAKYTGRSAPFVVAPAWFKKAS